MSKCRVTRKSAKYSHYALVSWFVGPRSVRGGVACDTDRPTPHSLSTPLTRLGLGADGPPGLQKARSKSVMGAQSQSGWGRLAERRKSVAERMGALANASGRTPGWIANRKSSSRSVDSGVLRFFDPEEERYTPLHAM